MFNVLAKRSLKDSLLKTSVSGGVFKNSARMFISKLDEKEKGDERIFFNKQDGKFIVLL
jgi:hypothetical protein